MNIFEENIYQSIIVFDQIFIHMLLYLHKLANLFKEWFVCAFYIIWVVLMWSRSLFTKYLFCFLVFKYICKKGNTVCLWINLRRWIWLEKCLDCISQVWLKTSTMSYLSFVHYFMISFYCQSFRRNG